MAGLLDILGTSMDDPKTMGLLALAGSMVKGDFGGGLLGYGQAYQGAQDNLLKRDLTKAQLDNLKSEVEARNAALDRQKQLMGLLPRVLGATQPAQQGQLGSGTFGIMPTAQGVPAIPQGSGGIGNANISDLATIEALGGPKLLDYYKAQNEGFERKPGSFYDLPGKGRQYIADPTKGVDFQGGRVSALPGYADFLTQQTLATEAPKTLLSSAATINLRDNPDGTKSPVSALQENPTLQNVLGGVFGQRQIQPRPQPAPVQQPIVTPQSGVVGKFEGDPAAVSSAIENIRDPQERTNARAAFEQQMRANNGQLPITYGKTTAQESRDTANKAFLEGRAKDSNAYESNLNGRVAQGTELNMRLQEQLAALQNFRAGGGAETRAQLAQMAQAIPGIPQSVVNGIAGGSLASMQEFNKLAAQTAMEQLKQSMGGAGRISQYEFKVFQNNNPNLSTDPDAIRKIFEFNNKIYRRDLSEQQAFNAHINSGGNPGDFPAQWAQRLAASGVTVPDMNTNATQAASLPTPVKGMVRNGYRFKGGDPSNPNSWEKQ